MNCIPAYTCYEILVDLLSVEPTKNIVSILDSIDIIDKVSYQQYSDLIDIGRQTKNVNNTAFEYIFMKYRTKMVSSSPSNEDEVNGRCSKFKCNCFSYLDECGEVIDEDTPEECLPYWFSGRCQLCQKVLKLEQVFRHRLPESCWKGCYCSKECLNHDCELYREMNPEHCTCLP